MPAVKTATSAMAKKVMACTQASNAVGAMFLIGTEARFSPITATTDPVTTGGIRRSTQPVPVAITTKPISGIGDAAEHDAAQGHGKVGLRPWPA